MRRPETCFPLAFAVLSAIASLPAQQLVRDINQNPPVQQGRQLGFGLSDGQRIFFSNTSPDSGEELWVSDGTIPGTHMVRDLAPGLPGSGPEPLMFLGNRLLFSTRTGTTRDNLWSTDGTSAGTVWITDSVVSPGQLSALGVLQGHAIFSGFGASGIWSTDLTAAGTQLLASASLLGADNLSTVLGNQIVFAASTPAAGNEPWVTDGTSAGTHLLADLLPGNTSSRPGQFATLGNRAWFLAADANNRLQLWSTDGTAVNTALVLSTTIARDFDTEQLRAINGSLFLIVQGALWISNGTAAGTNLLVPQGSAGNVLQLLTDGATGFFFRGSELWHTDGTAAGTAMLINLPGAAPSAVTRFHYAFVQGRAFLAVPRSFVPLPGSPGRLVVSDGSLAGTSVLPEAFGLFATEVFGAVGSRVVYGAGLTNAPVSGQDLLVASDGTAAGRQVLLAAQQQVPGISVVRSTSMDGVLYSFLNDGTHGSELWRSDGTAAGTQLVVDLVPGSGPSAGTSSEMVALDGVLYFTAAAPATGPAVWRTDGTAAGTSVVHAGNAPGRLQAVGHELYFQDFDASRPGFYLFHSDGTPAGTARITTAQVAYAGTPFAVLGGVCLYNTAAGSLGRSDGTAAGTFGLLPSGALGFDVIGGHAIVLAVSTTTGFMALWITDGTVAGTQLLADHLAIGPFEATGNGIPNVLPIHWLGRTCWYDRGVLACTDGTVAGTTVVSLPLPADVRELVPSGALLLGVGSDQQHGRELWRTDGTSGGTYLAVDLAPGPQDGVVEVHALGSGSMVWLSASNGQDGLEPYVSDGSAFRTSRLADISPQGSSNPHLLGIAGDRVYFLADDGSTGPELWSVPLGVIGNAATEPLGIGCPGSMGIPELDVTAPRLGGTLDCVVRGARPFGLAVFAFDAATVASVLPSGCVLRVGAGAITALVGADGTGRASVSLRVPYVAALVGREVTAQAATLDPQGTALPGLALSNGMLMIVGM